MYQIDHEKICNWLFEEVGIPRETSISLKGCDTDPSLIEVLDIKFNLNGFC